MQTLFSRNESSRNIPRRHWILGLVVLVLLAFNLARWAMEERGPARVGPVRTFASNIHPQDLRVRLDSLDAQDEEFVEVAANPFKDLAPPPPPKVQAPPKPPGKSPEELAAEQARKDLAQYRVEGILEEGGRRTAFLSKGQDLYTVGEGDKMGKSCRVKTVEAGAVTLVDEATRVEVRLELGGGGKP